MPTSSKTDSPQATGDAAHSLPVLLAQIAIAVAVPLLASRLGLAESVTQTVTALAAGLPAVAFLTWHQRRKPRLQRISEAASGLPTKSPVLIATALGAFLALAESLFGMLSGMVIGATAFLAERPDVVGPAMASIGSPLVVVGLLATSLASAMWVCHYLPRRRALWLLLASVTYGLIRIIVLLSATQQLDAMGLAFTPLYVLVNQTFITALVYLCLIIGAAIGWHRHSSFVIARLFRQLATEDRDAAVEIIRESVLSQAMRTGQDGVPSEGDGQVGLAAG